jgi:hypothetical protein
MKQTIEIECPNGYKPVYNPDTKKVEIIPDNVMDRVKTYEDARRCLGYVKLGDVTYNRSINALAKLQTILEALNKGHKFKLLTGNVWYPWVRFYRVDSIPEGSKIVRYFSYQGEKFALVGGGAYGSDSGLGYFDSNDGVGFAYAHVGMFACKSREIAEYVSTQFGELVFEACFSRHFDADEFKWLNC